MRTPVKVLSIGALAVTSLFVAPAAFAADSTATATVTGGSLTASATGVTLGSVTTAHTDQNSGGSLTLAVNDLSGTGDGWNVTQQVSDFAYSGDNDGTAIGAANFAVTNAGAVATTSGSSIDGVVSRGGTVGALDTARTVVGAAADSGEGAYTVPVAVNLNVPANSRVGTYTATITTTVTPGGAIN